MKKNNILKHFLVKIVCYMWKHEITINDNGCDVCDRCGKHEYYDGDFHNGKPIFKTIQYFEYKIYRLKLWYRMKIKKELPF